MSKTITIQDKKFNVTLESTMIEYAIKRIACDLNRDMENKNPLFLVVLNGAFMFAGDLMKLMTMECQVSFIKISSYSGLYQDGGMRKLIGLDEDIAGRNVVIVEDIVDTGKTIDFIVKELNTSGAASIKIATMLFKKEVYKKSKLPHKIDYAAIGIQDKFIVGRGLDYNGYGRGLKDLYFLKE